ncbi:MAG: Crp/Fnr family transcriptional regulator [Bdellovibrionales bacterium]|nr:Crp/Fnr family transcriptional regulator [Bdellovibrionales bacterium]
MPTIEFELCDSGCLTCPVNESNPFSVLSKAELRELRSGIKQYSFKKGEFLFKSGDPVQGIFCISSGIAKITQTRGTREIVVRLVTDGDWVGHRSIFTSQTYRGSAQVKELTRVCFIPTETLLHLFSSNKDFAYRLIRLIAHDLENAERRLLEQQKLNVPTRLISLLRVLDKKFGIECKDGRALSAKITKVELAEMVGASQEVVSRQLSKWKKENLLREQGKKIFLSNRLLSRVTR